MPKRLLVLERGLKSEYLRERRAFKRHGLRAALAQLKATRNGLRALLPLAPETFSAVEGVCHTHSAGRKAWIKAKSRDDAALHEWRKQAQYLLNELELLRDIFGVDVKKLRRRAQKIGDLLGDDHDLSVLSAKIRHYGAASADLLKHIKKRRRHLQRGATKQAKKLYSYRSMQIGATIARQLGSSN